MVDKVDKVTRLEIIDYTKDIGEGGGRTEIFWDSEKRVELYYQDNGRTLKIFITKRTQPPTNKGMEK